MSAIADWFIAARWFEILAAAVVLNVLTLVSSIALFRLAVERRLVADAVRGFRRRDCGLAASTTVVNALAILPPWWLWTEGFIELPSASIAAPLEAIYLVLGIDLAMYGLHRLFHHRMLYRLAHERHHVDAWPPCELTLFVMHPIEAAGFGAVVAALLLLHPVSVVGIALFFAINLVVGTLAHVPRAATATRGRFFGGASLHQGHHEDPDTNFGFFTQFWDRALGTFR